jgi:hypothetical protein
MAIIMVADRASTERKRANIAGKEKLESSSGVLF